MQPRVFSDQEVKQIVDDYSAGTSLNVLSQKHQAGSARIKRCLIEQGITIKNHSEACRTYRINENFLDEIDTEIKAYYLGFMYADGYNGQGDRRYSAKLSLQHRDRHILDTFAQAFETQRPIYKSRHLTTFEFTNKKLSLRLAELGCHRAKTFTLTFPDWTPRNLLPHFIRGYMDGDGYITFRERASGKRAQCVVGMTGNVAFTTRLAEVIQSECGVKTYGRHHADSEGIVSLAAAGRDRASKLLAWLYKDATVYLERKKRKAEQVLVPFIKEGQANGSASHLSVLNEIQVREIKERILSDETFESIAECYNVTDTCIKNIARGKTWHHLTGWNDRKNAVRGYKKGEKHYAATLTDDQVIEIKRLIQQGEKNVIDA